MNDNIEEIKKTTAVWFLTLEGSLLDVATYAKLYNAINEVVKVWDKENVRELITEVEKRFKA